MLAAAKADTDTKQMSNGWNDKPHFHTEEIKLVLSTFL